MFTWKALLGSLCAGSRVAFLAICVVGLAGVFHVDATQEHAAAAPQGDCEQHGLPVESATIDLFRSSSPSVVSITVSAVGPDRRHAAAESVGGGTGFVWDREGHIVTSYHVVQFGYRAEVQLADGSTWQARLVGGDAASDLAVLQIDAPQESLHPLELAPSGALQVGQHVFAIGGPSGFTASRSIQSGAARSASSLPSFYCQRFA